jgi:hypothetical protein
MVQRLPPDLHGQMERWCAAMDRVCAPASAEPVARWLLELGMAGVANAPHGPTDVLARAAEMAFTCSAIPAWARNAETLRQALGKFVHFPAPAEVLALLTAYSRPFMGPLGALRKIVAAGPLSEPAPEPLAEHAAEVAAQALRRFGRRFETHVHARA